MEARMPRKLHALVFAALSLTLLGPAAAAEDAEEAIRSQLDRFEEAFNAGKGAEVGAFYTQDAIAFPPGSPRVEGREAIGKLWQSVIDSGAKDLQLEALEVGEGSEKTAYEVGRVMLTTPDGPAEGKYIVIWKLDEDGAWRLHRDIWNMNAE
jgi:ketosteroid isomerase-like protein